MLRKLILVFAAALGAAGCVTTVPPTSVHQPMTIRPESRAANPPVNGSIYAAASARPLFEDRRARFVGDVITINIAERTQAQKQAATNAERKQSVTATAPTLVGVLGKGVQGTNVSLTSDNKLEGTGDSSANNNFTGTITVTVIEVLGNGNLLVSGEKQIGINQGSEYVRFSGVVNPNNITGSNTVQSTQVADARIEYRANGVVDEAQVMGWLARFFLTFLPF